MDITPIMENRMATEIELKMDTRREAGQGMGPAPPAGLKWSAAVPAAASGTLDTPVRLGSA